VTAAGGSKNSKLKIQFGARICQSTPCSNLLLKNGELAVTDVNLIVGTSIILQYFLSIFGNAGGRRMAGSERR